VVLKPSETTPVSTLLMAKLMGEILPPGVINVVCGAKETGAMLVRHPTPALCSVTGSVRAGKEVAAAAAPNLVRTHLELGGKAPVVVFADADLKKAAADIAIAGYFNAGQDCTAATRVIVEAPAYEEFVRLLAEQAMEAKLGTATTLHDEGILVGPLNNKVQFERVSALLSRVPRHAKVVCGGQPIKGPGFFVPPTVIADLKQDDELIQEEIFGPLLPIISYDTIDEAIQLIKARPKPLAFYLFSTDSATQEKVLGQVSFGGGCVNDTIVHLANSRLPFGGVGESGMGSYHGAQSFETFSHRKSVFQQTTLMDVPLRYPPYKGKEGILKFLVG
jgi:betaine-aldehyde dehydrogenase